MSEPSASAGIDLHALQVRKFRLQDKFFHHSTQLFAFVVLAALVGILVSLTLEAWPSLKEFGPAFLGIWLDERTLLPELRTSLLGLKRDS